MPGTDPEALRNAILDGDEVAAAAIGDQMVDEDADLMSAVEGASEVIREVGDRFGAGEVFLPEMVLAAEAMQAFMAVVTPHLGAEAAGAGGATVVVATVKGDIHSIGKNIVATMLGAAGYKVVDLGVNVAPMDAIREADRAGATIIGLSALMTTSMPFQKEVVALLDELDRRDDFWVMVGGGPVTSEYAAEIGANAWAPDAAGAVQASDAIAASEGSPASADFIKGGRR